MQRKNKPKEQTESEPQDFPSSKTRKCLVVRWPFPQIPKGHLTHHVTRK
jgi:hypothetical protein